MFKIGNSKELPAIPDHLSGECKDFVRQCLQREPSKRPTAAELLRHPFVKHAALPDKSIAAPDPLERIPGVSIGPILTVLLMHVHLIPHLFVNKRSYHTS